MAESITWGSGAVLPNSIEWTQPYTIVTSGGGWTLSWASDAGWFLCHSTLPGGGQWHYYLQNKAWSACGGFSAVGQRLPEPTSCEPTCPKCRRAMSDAGIPFRPVPLVF